MENRKKRNALKGREAMRLSQRHKWGGHEVGGLKSDMKGVTVIYVRPSTGSLNIRFNTSAPQYPWRQQHEVDKPHLQYQKSPQQRSDQ